MAFRSTGTPAADMLVEAVLLESCLVTWNVIALTRRSSAIAYLCPVRDAAAFEAAEHVGVRKRRASARRRT